MDVARCRVTIAPDDFIMDNHRVHGVRVLPGVTLLDVVCRVLSRKDIDPAGVTLRDIVFPEPIAVGESAPYEFEAAVSLDEDGGRFTVTGVDSGTVHARGRIAPGPLDVPDALATAPDAARRDMETVYARARGREVAHGDLMRCDGPLWDDGDALRAEIALRRPETEQGFHLHPAVADAATLLAFCRRDEAAEAYLPFVIDAFWAPRPPRGTVTVEVPGLERLRGGGDLMSNELVLRDERGRVCAAFQALQCKRIRHAGLIGRADPEPPREAGIRAHLRGRIARLAGTAEAHLGDDVGFYDLGLDSVALLRLGEEIEELVGTTLYPTLLFEYNTIDLLVEYLETEHGPLDPPSADAPEPLDEPAAEPATLLNEPIWTHLPAPPNRTDPRGAIVLGDALPDLADDPRIGDLLRLPSDTDAQQVARAAASRPECDAILMETDGGDRAAVRLWNLATALVAQRPARTIDLVQLAPAPPRPGTEALAAMGATITAETPSIRCRLITGDASAADALDEAAAPLEAVTRYDGGRRLVRRWRSAPVRTETEAFSCRGAQLITGGSGALAGAVAETLAARGAASILLLGRRAPDAALSDRLRALQSAGADAHYLRADAADEASLRGALDEARRLAGPIKGVWHLAGAVDDGVYFRKDEAALHRVLAPKTTGTVHLDALTAADPLDHFTVFSSLSAFHPNPGQADYAYANAFLCDLIAERERRSDRSGRSTAIAWPLWTEGGMRPGTAAEPGDLAPLATDAAWKALDAIWAAESSVTAVTHGPRPDVLPPEPATAEPTAPAAAPAREPIAIVGLAGRYPRAETVADLWPNLLHGRDCVTDVPADRWPDAASDLRGRKGGFLDRPGAFDAAFFSMSRKEAEQSDPQERLFLTTAWHAVEDAGYAPRGLTGRVGVYAGVMWNHYQLWQEDGVAPPSMHASVANRVSHALRLNGPSMAVDTACSSSLTAVLLAVAALRSGEIDMAIAGGVNVAAHPQKYRQLAKGRFLSETGRCRPFGAGADGYVPGEGTGAVVLKPLSAARRDRDHVYALIEGGSLNHNAGSAGLTVPDPSRQAALIADALADAGWDPETVGHIEAHGTGTALGDPIEAEALQRVLRGSPCHVGSIKSNLGHLEGAAGIAGLTKTVLQLRHRTIAPTLHADPLNPDIDSRGGLIFPTSPQPWDAPPDRPRRAGLSAFGAGGANAHLLVAEAPPEPARPDPEPRPRPVLFSAKTPTALRAGLEAMAAFLAEADADPWLLDDLAFTTQVGREALPIRFAVVAATAAELADALAQALASGDVDGRAVHARGGDPELQRAVEAWTGGADPDRPNWNHPAARRISLPGYVFDLEDHWIGQWKRRHDTHEATTTTRESEGTVRTRRLDDGIFHLTLDAPSGLLTDEATAELRAGLDAAVADGARAVVISGTGDVFSAGADRDALRSLRDGSAHFTDAPFVYEGLASCPVPVIAAMNGHASGGGLAFGLHADMVVMSRDSVYSANFVAHDITPGMGATYIIEQRFGRTLAREMLYTGRTYTGAELERRGASVAFADHDRVLDEALAMASGVARRDATIVGTLKANLGRRSLDEMAPVIENESHMHRDLFENPAPATPHRDREPDAAAPAEATTERVRAVVEAAVCEQLYLSPSELDVDREFSDAGLDSVGAVDVAKTVADAFGVDIDSTAVYDHPTPQALTAYAASLVERSERLRAGAARPEAAVPEPAPAPTAAPTPPPPSPAPSPSPAPTAADEPPPGPEPIAVIGMAGVYPDAPDLEQFWRNLVDGRDSVRDRARWGEYTVDGRTRPARVAEIDHIEPFDSKRFRISPLEVEAMDPQQRLFLRVAWDCITDAGQSTEADDERRWGVYVGCNSGEYLDLIGDRADGAHAFLGNSSSVLASRIAHRLDLTGPAVALDTACSSSLTAVHLACEALRTGDCDAAIAGGVALMLTSRMHRWCDNTGMLSPTGTCAPYAATADGMVLGEGAGAVMLKPLSRARADGDTILGLIYAGGIGGDGRTNGITAPSARSQTRLLRRVHERTPWSADITYVEGHGTGTPLGDPVEVKALGEALGPDGPLVHLGSVKGNIGHTTMAAGIAGLHKVLLALRHGQLPPTLHFSEPNPEIDFGRTRLRPVHKATEWSPGERGRRIAAVSGFGFSGTGAHLVVGEADGDTGPRRTERADADASGMLYAPEWTPADAPTPAVDGDTVVYYGPGDAEAAAAIAGGGGRALPWPQPWQDHCDAADNVVFLARQETGDAPPGAAGRALVPLLRSLAREHGGRRLRLTLVTAGTADTGAEAPPRPAGSELAGFASSARAEQPDWDVRHLDLPAAMDAASAVSALRSTPTGSAALREGRWLRRVLRPAAAGDRTGAAFRDGGVYLVVGGAGGIGGRLCRHLAERHRARLVVLGRRSEREAAEPLNELRDSGAEVAYVSGDVARRADVDRAVATALERFGALHGIVHSALVLRDRPLAGLTLDEVEAQWEAKLAGSVHLGEVAERLDIETLVFFSSAVAFTDSPGQAAYAAASAFQDAYARSLDRRVGTAVRVVNWGYWGSVGAVSSAAHRDRFARLDVAPIEVGEGLAACEAALAAGRVQTVAVKVGPAGYARLGIDAGPDLSAARSGFDALDRAVPALVAASLRRRGLTVPATGEVPPDWTVAEGWRPLAEAVAAALADHAPEAADLDAAPRPLAELLRDCADALPDVMSGRRAGTEVLFPDGSTDRLAAFYAGTDGTEAFHDVAAAILAEHLASATGPCRVVEIGAGTGSASRPALETCRASRRPVTYDFTDLSEAFVKRARTELAASYDFARFSRLDIEQDPAAQGFAAGTADVVVASHVLHATRDLAETLAHVRALLRPGGRLVIEETTSARPFLTAVFGLLPGWWRAADRLTRLPHSPLLSVPAWEAALREAGFGAVAVHRPEGAAGADTDHCVITAVAGPAETRPADLVSYVADVLAEVLKFDRDEIDADDNFDVLGVDSIVGLEIVARLERDWGDLPATILYEHNTAARLARHLEQLEPASRPAPAPSPPPQAPAPDDGIAVVGVAGTYPGADDPDRFWELLLEGRSAVGDVPPGRAELVGTDPADWPRAGYIDDIDRFDPESYGILPREAAAINPGERLFLDTARHLLEQTGHRGDGAVARTGVFAGNMYGSYGQIAAQHWPTGAFPNAHAPYWSVANRVSYVFDLTGPSYAVDSACSSSLLAVHLACESLRRGECDAAIAGGVNLILHPAHFQALDGLNMLSAQSECRVFDASADGMVPGEGVGAVLLKPLRAAIADGDDIWAVLRTGATNAAGKTSGYTVPNPNEQARVIAAAWEASGLDPAEIDYVEAHGTGTALGDPIELAGLRGAVPDSGRALPLGSVKANIGHLEGAAGIAGLTRVLLQLRHGRIAPCARLDDVNPALDLDDGRFALPRAPLPWEANGRPRRAGVSSFGAGGAGVHLVVEEHRGRPAPLSPSESPLASLLVLSARGPDALRRHARATAEWLRTRPDADLGPICHTSQRRRRPMRTRLAVRARDLPELADALEAFADLGQADGVWLDADAVTGDDPAAALSRQWLEGRRPDWASHWDALLPNVALPVSPTEPSRHWLEPLPTPETEPAPAAPQAPAPDADDLLEHLRAAAAEFLLVEPAEVDADGDLLEIGFDSVTLTELAERLNDTLGLDLLPTVFFEHPTLRRCAEHLRDSQAPQPTEPAAPAPTEPAADTHDIAIVGMAGRFPGADDPDRFWELLRTGADLVGPPPQSRRDLLADPELRDVQGGFLDSIDDFDPAPFGISPTEADLMDPQQRLFLTAAWQAIEHSGRRPERLRGTATGVWAGVSTIDYADALRGSGAADLAHTASGLSHAVLANRVSHLFDLRGPSMAVDTACSSSLVALHNAVTSLRGQETDFALVGGVNALLSPALFRSFERSGMLSPTGRCRGFDADADGYVRGEGVGVILLRRLADARADGDRVLAVVKGTALGHGGHANSLTAPNPAAQADVILRAHRDAGIDPARVHAIETHGTGTRLGDPIEAQALTAAFTELHRDTGRTEAPRQRLRIGTVKSNIGHLEAAAGIAGVIKAVQSLRHRELPPTLHVDTPNPLLRIDESPLLLNTAPHRWDEPEPLHIGVSSFGFGGANAHVVLASVQPQDEPALAPTVFNPRRHWFDRSAPEPVDHARPNVRLAPVDRARPASPRPAAEPAPAPALAAPAAPPPETTDDDLALIAGHLADILGIDPADIGPDTDLDALGLDSIFRMDLVRRLHRDRGVTFPAAELYDMATVGHLIARLRHGAPADSAEPVAETLASLISDVVGARIDPDADVVEAGMTSFHMLRVVSRLEKRLGTLPKTLLYDHPSPRALADHLAVDPARLDGVLDDDADTGDVYRWAADDDPGSTRVFRKSETAADPDLADRVERITAAHGRESGLAGRDIAPLGFLDGTGEAFLHFSRSGRDLLAWNYTGPESAFTGTVAEWFDYAERHGLRANLLSMRPLDRAGDHRLSATPFGALQRLENLAEFTLEGSRMRRLRYMVGRFAKAGAASVVEHRPGTDPDADAAVVGLIGSWGEAKTMVNPYVSVIVSELEQGRLDERHRMFLTYLDDRIVNAVIVTDIPSERGYLLDMEFYPPDMPLGGLDYTIVEIMGRLRDEGCEVFSFGASFGGDLTDASRESDTELAQALRQLREVGAFGPGNFQFKNKFRPVNHPLYLCQSATGDTTGAADVILMIAEPDLEATAPGLAPPPESAPTADPRESALAAADHNVTALDAEAVDLDLITDSWSEYTGPAVAERAARLAETAGRHGALTSPPWLRDHHLHPVPSGRAAEALLCRLWPYRRGTVLHDHAFPTWMTALAEHGFDAEAITDEPGPFDLAALERALEATPEVAFVLLEPHSNAAAGRPLTLDDLGAARDLCRRHGTPLVLDAARALDNALDNAESDPDAAPWEILRRSLAGTAAVTLSLSKTFGVAGGGVLAVAAPELRRAIEATVAERGHDVDAARRALFAAALHDTEWPLAAARTRRTRVAKLHRALAEAGAPVTDDPGGHAVFLRRDADAPPEADAATAAWIYRRTGVRAAPHLTRTGGLRLAVPVGMGDDDIDTAARRLADLWRERPPVTELVRVSGPGELPPRYRPADIVPDDVAASLREAETPAGDNAAVLAEFAGIETTTVNIDGGAVEIADGGEGPPVVAFGPFNVGAGVFADLYPALRDRCRLIAVHHPGVGATSWNGGLDLDSLADLARSVLDGLGVDEPAIALGTSFGGLIAQKLALRHPGRVARLLLLGSSYKVGNRKAEVNRLSLVAEEDFAAADTDAALLPRLLRCESMDPQTGLRYLDVFAADPDLLPELPSLAVPTLILRGEHDTVIPERTAHLLHGLIPGSEYRTLPGAGHFPTLTHPGAVADAITALLDDRRPS
ncbi:hypothetical protein GCM10027447_17910 [Glycomyces halotolerans]